MNSKYAESLEEAKKIFKTAASGIKGTASALADPKIIGQAALVAVLEKADDLFGGAARQALGFRPNPRTDVLFSHVGYRDHRMEYILIPRDEAEAKAIDHIIKFFQFYMLPSYSPTVGKNKDIEGLIMGFPYEFVITFWDEGTPSLHHFNKIGRSVLKSVTVDHAGGSQVAFFKAGNNLYPAVTKLSLEFTEVRLLARDEGAVPEKASTSASGKGLIDRGVVGEFDDPAAAILEKKQLSETEMPKLAVSHERTQPPAPSGLGNGAPRSSSYGAGKGL